MKPYTVEELCRVCVPHATKSAITALTLIVSSLIGSGCFNLSLAQDIDSDVRVHPSNELISQYQDPQGRLMIAAEHSCSAQIAPNSLQAISDCIQSGVDILTISVVEKDGRVVLDTAHHDTALKHAIQVAHGSILLHLSPRPEDAARVASILSNHDTTDELILEGQLRKSNQIGETNPTVSEVSFGPIRLSAMVEEKSRNHPHAYRLEFEDMSFLREGLAAITGSNARAWVSFARPGMARDLDDRLFNGSAPKPVLKNLLQSGVSILSASDPETLKRLIANPSKLEGLRSENKTPLNALTLSRLFSNDGMLQADEPVNVWGTGPAGVRLTIAFGDRRATTTIAETGNWSVHLPALPASFEPKSLSIVSEDGQRLIRKNILVGDIWIAAGQSNMFWELEYAAEGQDAFLTNHAPNLRLFKVERDQSLHQKPEVSGNWVPAVRTHSFGQGSVRKFSAVGYFFGHYLAEKIDRPIGIIQVAYGGTTIEAWTSPDIILNDPDYSQEKAALLSAKRVESIRKAEFTKQTSDWLAQFGASSVEAPGMEVPPPNWSLSDVRKNTPSAVYNAMLAPVLPFKTKGMIWYQGESNHDNAEQYDDRLTDFIGTLKAAWPNLSIGIVQIAPFRPAHRFPEIWQAQLDVTKRNNAGLIVITDLTHLDDIHPRKKKGVGHRLAKWALRDVYKVQEDDFSGPRIDEVEVTGRNKLTLNFSYARGLDYPSTEREKSGFEIVDLEGHVSPAKASIVDEAIVLNVENTSEVALIQYEWRSDANPQLTNSSGYPASPFRVSIVN